MVERNPAVFASAAPELILAAGSLRTLDLQDRVRAAAAGGFDAIGFNTGLMTAAREQGWTVPKMRSLFANEGVRLAELEVLAGFASTGPANVPALPGVIYGDREQEEQLFALADAFGVRHLQAVGRFDGRLETDAAEKFAALCERAAEHDLLVALEFVPTTGVPDAATATDVVTKAARSNGGICVDSWHHFRGARDDQQLTQIPADRVVVIQLDDGPLHPEDPDFIVDTISHRQPPGAGEFELAGFLQLLWAGGVEAPISIEVLSADLAELPAREVAVRLGEGTRRVIESARSFAQSG